MSIGSINGSAIDVGGVSGAPSVGSVGSNGKRVSSRPPPPPAASANISKPGELLSKLQQLSQQDPAKFKELVTQMAADLKKAAGEATGDRAQMLSKLADGFAQAASSGNLSALQASGPGGKGGKAGGHHHHHHGGGAPPAASGSDPMQAIVSRALDQVNQALGSSSTQSSTPT